MDKYPIYTLEIDKNETTFSNVDEIMAYLQEKVSAHPFAVEIAIFDHYAHTTGIEEHVIDANIKAAKNFVFCFGKMLPKPAMLAVRPRSIGVCELENSFEISFLEVPNEKLHEVTEGWAKSIKNK
jgi:phage tail protein X